MIHDGYQLIDPAPTLDDLLAATRSASIAVAMLTWLIELTRAELGERLGSARIDIVAVCHHGNAAYPGLGIHYSTEDPKDVGPLVIETVNKLVNECTLSDFIAYVARTNRDWAALANDFVDSRAT